MCKIRNRWILRGTGLLLIMILLLGCYSPDVFHAVKEIPKLHSSAYALTDGSTNRLLIGENEQIPMANASTTKILTCIVALESCDPNDMVTISSNAMQQPKVRLGITEGETYPLIDLLYAIMLESYNDCAVAIAEHVGGSEEGFATMLNDKAKEIGCTDTFFITPNGLDEERDGQFHHSTALDLCRIISYCIWESSQKDLFTKITQTSVYTCENGSRNCVFQNKNSFLNSMEGVVSGKTGFTAKAGYCYVAALEKNGERYCIALLACGWPNNKTYKWEDARALFTFGMENYENKIYQTKQINTKIDISGYSSKPKFQFLNQKSKLQMTGILKEKAILMGKEEKVYAIMDIREDVTLPIQKGDVLGTCSYYVEEFLIQEIPLYASTNADIWDFWTICRCVFRQYLDF